MPKQKKNKDNQKQVKLTEFQKRVYAALTQIPRGKVTTYKHLAQFLDCGSSQAVGQALKRNPYAPEIPCHRVIKSDRTIGGFVGQTSGKEIEKKIKLLTEEGVIWEDDDTKIDDNCIFTFEECQEEEFKIPTTTEK